MDKIQLTLTAESYNAIVIALRKRPYEEVSELIADINRQVYEQVNSDDKNIKKDNNGKK